MSLVWRKVWVSLFSQLASVPLVSLEMLTWMSWRLLLLCFSRGCARVDCVLWVTGTTHVVSSSSLDAFLEHSSQHRIALVFGASLLHVGVLSCLVFGYCSEHDIFDSIPVVGAVLSSDSRGWTSPFSILPSEYSQNCLNLALFKKPESLREKSNSKCDKENLS